MKKSVKRKLGRPPGRKAPRRPVISTRAPLEFYEAIKQAAQDSGRTISEELVWRAALSLEGAEARALLNVISGEIELAKATTSKHAPEDTRAREATCRVLAAIAHHLLPECQWVGIGMGVGPEDKPWFKVKVLTSTFPSTLSAEEATK